MANTAVKGRITNELDQPLGGLAVEVYDVDFLDSQHLLGTTFTLASGDYSVVYKPTDYGWIETKPDLLVRARDGVGRLLYESTVFSNVQDDTLDVGDTIIPRDVLDGWRVTLRLGYPASAHPIVEAEQFPMFSEGNSVTILVDNERAWRQIISAIRIAQHYINIAQLWFNTGRLFIQFDPPTPEMNAPTTGTRLEEELLQKNREGHVSVRILLNDFNFDGGLIDSKTAARRFFAEQEAVAPHTIMLRGFPRPYNDPFHAKFMVIDSKTAFVVGSPFIQGYFDDSSHSIDDPRRGAKSFFEHTDSTPLHDVSAAIVGPAVNDLDRTFHSLWDVVDTPFQSEPTQQAPKVGTCSQIVRTIPADLLDDVPDGETGILEGYLRAIRQARGFIYLDNQYFTEPAIAEALVKALHAQPALQIILILNGQVDIPFYNTLQPNLVNKMLDDLDSHARSRIGVFTLWRAEASSPKPRIARIYTHAKVAVVDDTWATIGSANLDGVSLRLSQHVIPPVTKRDRRQERSIEVNAMFFNGVDGLQVSGVPSDLRRTEWSEHLGLNDSAHQLISDPPAGGWLSIWKRHASDNLVTLRTDPRSGLRSRVLEWRPEAHPVRHLLALGMTRQEVKELAVVTSGRSFDFETGQWV